VPGKILGGLCLVAAVGYGVLYLMYPWLVARRIAKLDPRLSVVPSGLPTQGAAPLSGAETECCGFRLLLPNREIQTIYKGNDEMMVWLRSGAMLVIRNPSQGTDIYEALCSDRDAKKLLGQETLQSKLDLMQAAMSATPDQAKWWRFRSAENQKVDYLLSVKFIALTTSAVQFHVSGPVYTVALGQFRGFEQGSPKIPPYDAHLDLFDEADRHFALDIGEPDGHGQVITQEVVNAIVASIQPTANH
jgi:hypothetical protein